MHNCSYCESYLLGIYRLVSVFFFHSFFFFNAAHYNATQNIEHRNQFYCMMLMFILHLVSTKRIDENCWYDAVWKIPHLKHLEKKDSNSLRDNSRTRSLANLIVFVVILQQALKQHVRIQVHINGSHKAESLDCIVHKIVCIIESVLVTNTLELAPRHYHQLFFFCQSVRINSRQTSVNELTNKQ